MKEPSGEEKLQALGMVGAFLSAWQASFALLVSCLKSNGALRDGQFEGAIRRTIEELGDRS